MSVMNLLSKGGSLVFSLGLLCSQSLSGETVFGGSDTTEIANWTTSSVVFDDTVQSGHSFNWENVLTNEVAMDIAGNEFDLTWEAGVNHTIGHLFMYAETFDLSSVAGGIQGLLWHADLETTAFSNWSPVISVTVGGETRYYRWNHSGNDWNGNGKLNFSNPMNAVDDPNEFDLSQLGNASNAALGIWGELNAAAASFASTRDNPIGPNLQAAEGIVQFGFLQWASSGASALESTDFSSSIDCFEVIINPEPAAAPVLASGVVEDLSAVSATVQGEMTGFGNAYSEVSLYWGSSDGGMDFGAWENVVQLGVEFCDFEVVLSSLVLDSEYFFRWYAQNDAGGSWSDASGAFTTLSTLPPAIVVSEGSSPDARTVVFAGEVTETGNEAPIVTIYYGATDQGTNAGLWDGNVEIGAQGGIFSESVEGLSANTTYFYRVFAENSAGAAWSSEAASVTTLMVLDPMVIVTDGSSVSPGVAIFTGEVTEMGNEVPEVTIFYGKNDGGTNPGAWDEMLFLGEQGGLFSEELTNLEGGVDYFYRAFAENSGGAAWSPETATVSVMGFQGVPATLSSEEFDLRYEMDVNPSSLDLDAIGSLNDWFAEPAMATGVDQTMWIPQIYESGLAKSNQGAGTPEALFRSDFTGSVTRESLTGDFSVEVSLRLLEGTQNNPGTDFGGFSFFINPPGKPSLKLNINENTITTGFGENETAVGSNTDTFHQFRVSYVEADEKFWIWKDGTLIQGGTTNPGGGISGSEASVYAGGGFLLGDYSSDISGDWEVDYIRLNNAAAAPLGGALRIVDSGLVGPSTFFIDFTGNPSTTYSVKRSGDLSGFEEEITFFLNGTSPETDAKGSGRVEFDVSSSLPGRSFFRLEKP